MMVLMHTDFPDPVTPAIRRCGILARSATTDSPSRFLPRAIGRARVGRWYSAPSISSRTCTMRGMGFGTSMPTAAFPGMGATIRSGGAHREREVVGEGGDAPHFHARTRRHFVLRHHRSDRATGDRAFDPERLQRLNQLPPHLLDLRESGVAVFGGSGMQQLDRRYQDAGGDLRRSG